MHTPVLCTPRRFGRRGHVHPDSMRSDSVRHGSLRMHLLVISLLPLLFACGSDGPAGPAAGKVARITVSPGDVVLAAIGESKQLTGTAVDSKGGPVSRATLTWKSSDQQVATVDDTGLVVATGVGATEITASVGEISSKVPVKVSPAASQLAFATHPEDIGAGSGFPSALRVEVHDANGHLVAGSQAEITLSLAGGSEGAEILGTSTRTAAGGVASFEDLRVERAGSGYRIEASAIGIASRQSEEFTVSPAALHHLAFTKVPEAVEGQTPFAAEVEAQDRFGNHVSTWTGEVTLSLEQNPGTDSLAGTRVATAAHGTASFNDLSLANPGHGYTLWAEAAGPSAAESAPFDLRLTFAILSSGEYHTCGVTTTGKAYCWGSAEYGQIGNGSSRSSSVPVSVSGALEFSLVSAGVGHTCGVTTAGKAYCWGNGDSGRLGNGATQNASAPVPVSGGYEFVSLAAGGDHTCGTTTARKAYCWGLGTSGQLGVAGTGSSLIPIQVAGALEFATANAGDRHSCGLTAQAKPYCWGSGHRGQLGNGDIVDKFTPVAVVGGRDFIRLTSGGEHACGITSQGETYCWGSGDFDQLGDGGTGDSWVPTLVAGNHDFAMVSAGSFHSCGVTTSGKAYCWGAGSNGQLGNGNFGASHIPAAVSSNLAFTMVSAGRYHTCGLTADRKAYCWGNGLDGQLGYGDTEDSTVPVPVFGTER